eukprot:scaffold19779_cov18-Tisochrysis_lutea.AAC.1
MMCKQLSGSAWAKRNYVKACYGTFMLTDPNSGGTLVRIVCLSKKGKERRIQSVLDQYTRNMLLVQDGPGSRISALRLRSLSSQVNVQAGRHDVGSGALPAHLRAADYKNEKVVGQGIRDWLAADSNNKREDLFVTSKVWLAVGSQHKRRAGVNAHLVPASSIPLFLLMRKYISGVLNACIPLPRSSLDFCARSEITCKSDKPGASGSAGEVCEYALKACHPAFWQESLAISVKVDLHEHACKNTCHCSNPQSAPPCCLQIFNDSHRPEQVRASAEKTIADLGVGYLDMMLIHWPDAFKPGMDNDFYGSFARIYILTLADGGLGSL